MKPFLFAALAALCGATAFAADADHVAAVEHAQRGAYAMSDSPDGCPPVGDDLLGWPGDKVRECTFSEGDGDSQRTGVVYLLDVPAATIAGWIETTCANQLPGTAGCFTTVLRCAHENSGMMFPVSGNMMENMDGPWTNWFFRNGMTVRMKGQANNSSTAIDIERQDELARADDSAILRIPSGMTRFWRTRPRNFAAKYPDGGAPDDLATAEHRAQWLDLARTEMLAALASPTNRLLEAWAAAHTDDLARDVCSEE